MTSAKWRPSFLVIGAVKAATTWIQMRLQDNPAVFLPDPEPHYFSTGYEQGEESYHSFFKDRPPAARVIGEKSADYLAHPEAARRIAAMLPDARLIVQLRNPVERAYSDYKMFYRRGTLTGPPEEYLSDLNNPFPRFLRDGLYAQHLKRWLDVFPREQILVCLYENVKCNPRQVVEAVSSHIGVAPVFQPELARKRENNSQEAILSLPLRKALAPFKGVVRPLRGTAMFEGARSLLAREIVYPSLSPTLRAELADFYAPDCELLERLCGLDLRQWRTGPSPQVSRAVPQMASPGAPIGSRG